MIKFFILFNFIFTNLIKALYDFLIDYDNGFNSDPLLSEKNEIMIFKKKLTSINENIKSTIRGKLNDIIRERVLEDIINKTFEQLNTDLINFSNKSEKNIEEIRNNMSYLQTYSIEILK